MNEGEISSMKKGDLFNSIGVFRESLGYDAHGNITSISRYGKISSSGYGAMDNLTLSYDGNRLTGVSDAAADYDVAGSFEYKRANGSQYMYDSNGSLLADKSRGITYVAYDVNNNPQQIYIDNAGDTKYVYDASGRKLRVIHLTAVPNIMRKFGRKPADLTPSQILYADTTDYLLGGSLVMRNGRVDKVLFEGGYAQATGVGIIADTFAFNYYNQDHLGNNREVVDSAGTVIQVTSYYPFGTPYADPAAVMDADYQPYKYNGKELDRMHGLDTYDYGARQYDPILGRWDRMDPLCEKYYNVSPYAYCHNNPVMLVDPNGNTPVGAIVEGVGAFFITAGIDFFTKWIFEGQNINTAYSNINWRAAAFDGLSTAALSFFVDGTGSTKTFNKIASSKPGRFALGIAQTMTTNIISEIESGKSLRNINWQEELFYATISNCINLGMDNKANELLEWLKESNNKMYTSVKKLQRNLDAGKNDARIKSDRNQVKITRRNANKMGLMYGKEKNKNRVVSGGVTGVVRYEITNDNDD